LHDLTLIILAIAYLVGTVVFLSKFGKIPNLSTISMFLEWHTEGYVRVLYLHPTYDSSLYFVITLTFVAAKVIFRTGKRH
jgi:hypothetical protein